MRALFVYIIIPLAIYLYVVIAQRQHTVYVHALSKNNNNNLYEISAAILKLLCTYKFRHMLVVVFSTGQDSDLNENQVK